MGEDGRAIALDMLVEPDAGTSLGQHARKRGLAHFERFTPNVLSVVYESRTLASPSSARLVLVRRMLEATISASSKRKTKIQVRTPMR